MSLEADFPGGIDSFLRVVPVSCVTPYLNLIAYISLETIPQYGHVVFIMYYWMKCCHFCVGKPNSCVPAKTQSLLVTLHFPHWQVLPFVNCNKFRFCVQTKYTQNTKHTQCKLIDYPLFQQDNCLFRKSKTANAHKNPWCDRKRNC